MRGKSPDEVAAIAMQLADAVGRAAQGQPMANQPQAPQNAPQTQWQAPSNESWTNDPNSAAESIVTRKAEALFNPALQQLQALAQQTANTVRGLAEQKYSEDFRRWGPEINGYMAQIPADRRDLDAYQKVVTLVRGNHMDEIVNERVNAKMAQGGLGERSTGANGAAVNAVPGLDPNKIPAGFKALIDRHGLTETDVKSYCRQNGMSLDQWVGNMADGKMFTSASPFQITMTEESLGIKRGFDG